jgi:2-dehydropantoate 2-reductase
MNTPVDRKRLRIAIVGPGGIGSTFAFHLARAGHDVTVVARGTRLERLRRDGAIHTTDGGRARVHVADELDTAVRWDLVLVSVLFSEVDVLLPALAKSATHTIMFMFNTFKSLDHLSEAVGAMRTTFGFPAIVARVEDGRLSSTVLGRGATTTVSDPYWAEVFSDAGIPTAVHPDMQSWLRTHAAIIVPLALAAHSADRMGGGVSWREATRFAHALREGLQLVSKLGDSITPAPIAVLDRLPVLVSTASLWALTRLRVFTRTMSVAPKDEPRMLIDEMNSVAPHGTPALLAVRPNMQHEKDCRA